MHPYKLYYAKKTCALAPHIVLEELGVPYEAVAIDFSRQEQSSPAYLELNPKGRVPLLITEEGALTEAPAILGYLAETHPDAGLLPGTPFARAQAQSFNAYLCATVHVSHAHRFRGARWSDDPAAHESMAAKVAENMTAHAATIEEHLLRGPWVMGEDYSICDPYLFTNALWMEADGVDLSTFPQLNAHRARMAERPAVKAVMELHG